MQHVKLLYRRKLNRNIIRIRGGKEGVIDRLLRWVVFYDTRANKLLSHTYYAVKEQNAVLAGELLRDMGKIHDRLADFANKVLPYISPRLQSLEINKKVTKRYVMRVPSQIKNTAKWLDKVKEEQKQIPKFDVNKALQSAEDAEEIEFNDDLDYEIDRTTIN